LQGTQFTVLVILSLMGTVSISQLAEALIVDRTTLSRNLKPLEKKGYISIDHDSDRRIKKVTITRKGDKALFNSYLVWRKAQDELIRDFGKTRWNRLQGELEELISLIQTK